jgi:gliding motility-associated lipoprotein GldH
MAAIPMNKQWIWIGIAAASALLSSCGEGRLYEQYSSFERAEWKMTDSAAFNLQKVDFASSPLTQIGIKYNENYPFSNLYLSVIAKDSSETVLGKKLINMPLFDSKSGKPLGDGFGNSFTKLDSLPIDLPLGTSQVIIYQYMRQESLKGVESVGLKISKKDQ